MEDPLNGVVLPVSIWKLCTDTLKNELSLQQFNTWIRPLRIADSIDDGDPQSRLKLLAPNRFVMDWVNDKYLPRIQELTAEYSQRHNFAVEIAICGSGREVHAGRNGSQGRFQRKVKPRLSVHSSPMPSVSGLNNGGLPGSGGGSHLTAIVENSRSPTGSGNAIGVGEFDADAGLSNGAPSNRMASGDNHHPSGFNDPISTMNRLGEEELENAIPTAQTRPRGMEERSSSTVDVEGGLKHRNYLNESFNFRSFVEGKSNQLGLAAARQVAENPGGAYNPLFIYGGVGLGKTHLMHAVGNAMVAQNPRSKIVYLHSERFVADMVKALQLNAISDFKRYYRSVDALLIDDIQFFAGKERSQEEFFHTFNALLEGGQQIILTCDRYPKEITGVEERLKSRFGWGLTVPVEPPELETRVAILMKKAEQSNMLLPNEVAFFIAQRIRSNVRELEGALKRVIASAHFTGRPIDIHLVREALKDLLALQDKQVSIDNIQRVVAEYYKIKVGDILSKRRSRSVARPRQVAMTLAKELTNHSLPEIGDAFGGRDHTTVLHACRKIRELRETDADIGEDWKNLQRSLTT